MNACNIDHVFLIIDGSESGVHVGTEDWNETSSGTDQENTDTELFWLDYQADSGTTTSFIVHKVFNELY